MSDRARVTANRDRAILSLEELNKRELQIYEKGFLDGRANMMAEFLAAFEEELPTRQEIPSGAVN
jgi:hypothetical protein